MNDQINQDFLEARRVIFSNIQTDSNLIMSRLINFSYELGQIITGYDVLEARRAIQSNVRNNYNFT